MTNGEAARHVMSFGQFKDRQVKDADREYLWWLLKQNWFEKKYPDDYDAVYLFMNPQ